MLTRILVSVVGIPLLLAVFFALPPFATTLLVTAMAVVAVYELLHGTGLVNNKALSILAAISALVVSLWCSTQMHWIEALIGLWTYMIALACCMLWSKAKLDFRAVCVSVFAGVILPLLLSAITRIRCMKYGEFYILIPFVLCFGTDSAAYFVGCAIGKHKMAPNISPKKSWEGAVGGCLGGIVLMLVYTLILDRLFGLEVRYLAGAVYGVCGAIVCVIGDLFFSVIKRQTGIKDYGKLLPGHGGVLDRFDSMTFVAPLAEILLILLPLIAA